MASPVSPATSSVGSCTRCYGWGRPGGDGVCAACAAWLPRGRRDGCCRRCRHVSRLNRDALCRPCILEVRSADLEWVIADLERCTHHLQPRGHQLVLLLDGVKLAAGQPSRKRDQRPQRLRLDQRHLWLRDRLSMPEPADDPNICPPQVPGQLVLLRLPRAFLLGDARRIRDRPIADLPAWSGRSRRWRASLAGVLAGAWRRSAWRGLAQHALAGHDTDGRPGGQGDQLWFGGGAAPQLWTSQPGAYDHKQGRRATQQRRAAQGREAVRAVSPGLVDPNQLVLFEAPRRNWRRVERTALPALTGPAQQLLDEFDQFARAQSWTAAIRAFHLRSLRLLLAWLGAAAPIHEVDIKAVATLGPSYAGQCITQFLRAKGLLIPDPATAIDADHADVQWLLATLPGHLVPEVEAWIRVLRGEGRRPSPVMGWALIRRYLAIAAPVLRQWGERGEVDSLRSITTDDVQAALKSRPGSSVRRMQTALRSLFRALKRERLIFRDPARGITVTRASRLPQPLPSDRLRGLLDRAPTTMAKLAVALVAIHALRPVELRRLHLADLNRARGRLTVRRPVAGRDRIVILNELTLRLAGTWLRERAQRWPHNTNPHLLISQQTAVDPSQPPVCRFTVQKLFFPLAITPGQLRADRILDEARHTADPVHLMRLFAIADNTAMKYVYTAHPERRAVPPR